MASASRLRQAAAADEARTADPDVEIAEDAAQRQRARPALQFVEFVVGVAAADQGADRGADNDVGLDAVLEQRVDNADMRKAARRAAAENKPDRGTGGRSPDERLGSNVVDRHQILDSRPDGPCNEQTSIQLSLGHEHDPRPRSRGITSR